MRANNSSTRIHKYSTNKHGSRRATTTTTRRPYTASGTSRAPVAALSSVTSLAVVGEELLPMSCEDCGAGLGQGGTGGTEPQHDDYGCCGACRKAVCFSCSVTNLGEQRRCLACAGRKIGVGGLGWTVPSASVC